MTDCTRVIGRLSWRRSACWRSVGRGFAVLAALGGAGLTAWAAPTAGRYNVSLCSLPPNAPEQCRAAVAEVRAEGDMVVRHPQVMYAISFPSKYRQAVVKVNEKGHPAGQFLADFEWRTPQVFHFSETQPTQWEIRFPAPATSP